MSDLLAAHYATDPKVKALLLEKARADLDARCQTPQPGQPGFARWAMNHPARKAKPDGR